MKQPKKKEYEEFQQYLYNKAHGYIWTPDTLELICSVNDNDPERIGKQMLKMRGKLRNEQVAHMTSDKHKNYVIRSLRRDETDLLKDFLYEAIFIPKGAEPPARDIVEEPELRVYTDIAVSANVQEKDRNDAMEAGMDGFTEKPIFVDKLFATMKKYLDEEPA